MNIIFIILANTIDLCTRYTHTRNIREFVFKRANVHRTYKYKIKLTRNVHTHTHSAAASSKNKKKLRI